MKKLMTILCSLVLLTVSVHADYDGQTEPETFEAKYYDNAKVVRVKYTSGETYIKRSYDEGVEEATVNLPIFEEDIAGTTDGRLELYLGKLNYLRLDNDTEISLEKAPVLRKTNAVIRVLGGGVYLDVNRLDFEKDIEIQTPDCGIFILNTGLYRINVIEGQGTEVFVHDGLAEVAGEDYSRNVRENQQMVMLDGNVRERPFYFASSRVDDFDRWNKRRIEEVGYARYSTSRYLDEGYEDWEYELSRHGRWRYENSFHTYVWIPYNIGSHWRPYNYGRWIWSPFYGYVWNSYDPWGWYTHYYGRWHWDTYYGWYWIPGYRWSPAWVSWFWDDYHYGWCPLSYWNRPIIIMNGRWWHRYHYRRGIPMHSMSTIIIRKDRLMVSNVRKHALTSTALAKYSGKNLAFRGGAPSVRPIYKKTTVINAKGKPVVYKKNGIVSTDKYKVTKTGSLTVKAKTTEVSVYKYSGDGNSKIRAVKYSSSTGKRGTALEKSSTKIYKSPKSSISGSKSSSKYRYRPKSSESSGTYSSKSSQKSSSSSTSSSKSKYSSKSGKSSSKSSKSSSKSSSKNIKIKKKKQPTYFSSRYSSSGSDNGYRSSYASGGSSYSASSRSTSYKRYSSRYKSTQPSSKSYSSSYSSSSPSNSRSYSSYQPKSYTRSSPPKAYSSSSGKSYSSSSSSSSKSYSSPSYKNSSRSSKSYSSPSYKSSSRSSYSSSSYSKSSSSSSSSRSSYSRSSSRSGSSSSSKSSSSGSYRRKNK